jgi:hypothetical protein
VRKLVWFALGYGGGCFLCAYFAFGGLLWLALAAAPFLAAAALPAMLSGSGVKE